MSSSLQKSDASPGAPSRYLAAHVVLEWVETTANGEERRYLTEPDPNDTKIFFESQISSIEDDDATTGVFLRLRIPAKLKNATASRPIHVHIQPSRIQSPTFAIDVEAPDVIKAKLPGRLARFSMMLSEPVQIIIPSNISESPSPKSSASGKVLDAIRSLNRATQLSMYMSTNTACRAHLPSLCASLSGGNWHALPLYTELSRLFGASGGRLWEIEPSLPAASPPFNDAEEAADDIPPPYDQVPPGPPMPPLTPGPKQDGKRRRRSSTDSIGSVASGRFPTAKKADLRASPSRFWSSPGPETQDTQESSILQRLMLLEGIVGAQAQQIAALSTQNQQQQKRIDDYEAELAALRSEMGRVDEKVDKLDIDLAAQQDDIESLNGDVEYCLEREDTLTEAVTEAVLDHISTRGFSASNLILTLGDG